MSPFRSLVFETATDILWTKRSSAGSKSILIVVGSVCAWSVVLFVVVSNHFTDTEIRISVYNISTNHINFRSNCLWLVFRTRYRWTICIRLLLVGGLLCFICLLLSPSNFIIHKFLFLLSNLLLHFYQFFLSVVDDFINFRVFNFL